MKIWTRWPSSKQQRASRSRWAPHPPGPFVRRRKAVIYLAVQSYRSPTELHRPTVNERNMMRQTGHRSRDTLCK